VRGVKNPDFFLPAAAALHAGVSELEIHEAIADGSLRSVVFGGEVRIPKQALEDFLARRSGAGSRRAPRTR